MLHECEGTSFGVYIKPLQNYVDNISEKSLTVAAQKPYYWHSLQISAIDSFAWPSHPCIAGNVQQQENLTDPLASVSERKDSFYYRSYLDETTQWKLSDTKERLHQYYQLEYWKFHTQSVGNLQVKLKKESTVSPERRNYFRRVGPKKS